MQYKVNPWHRLSLNTQCALGLVGFLALGALFVSLENSDWNKRATVRMNAALERQCVANNHGKPCPPASDNPGDAALIFEMSN